jgi:mortality factor 4-like protein 1
MSAEPSYPPKLATSAKCFARESGSLYPAIVRKSQFVPSTAAAASSYKYFVHYMGWNVKWDKWVNEHDLLPDDEEARELVKMVKERKKGAVNGRVANKAAAEKAAVDKDAEGGGSKDDKKRPLPDEATAEEVAAVKRAKFLADSCLLAPALPADPSSSSSSSSSSAAASHMSPLSLTLQLPFNLKKILVDDWESITGGAGGAGKRFVILPTKRTVSSILASFLAGKESSEFHKHWEELARTLKIYFDKSLSLLLLYPPERDNHASKTEGYEGSLCDLYGIEHLLRLFIKLPAMLSTTTLTSGEAKSLLVKVSEIVRWLSKEENVGEGARYGDCSSMEIDMQ